MISRRCFLWGVAVGRVGIVLWEMKDFGCIICCVFGEGIVAWVGLDLFNFFFNISELWECFVY